MGLELDLELLKADARKYKSAREWNNNSPTAYKKSLESGFIDEIAPHMKKATPWTKAAVLDIAKTYTSKSDWQKNDKNSYMAAYRRKEWFLECCELFSNSWTQSRCITDATSYNTRQDWREGSNSAYQSAVRNGWLALCLHGFD